MDNDEFTAKEARKISEMNLKKKQAFDINCIEKYVYDIIMGQAEKGEYYTSFNAEEYAKEYYFDTQTVISVFNHSVRSRLTERGFRVTLFPFVDYLFFISWDET